MRIPFLISIMLSTGLTLIYLFQGNYPDFMYAFSNAFPPLIACVAVVASAFTMMKYWGKPGDRFSRIWLCFTLGMLFWFLGELGWSIYTLLLGVEVPYPSIADAAWLIGYIPLFAALYLYVRAFRFAIPKLMNATAEVVVSALGIVLFVLFGTQILVASAGNETTTLLVDLAYPALDLCLLSLSILGLLIFAKGRIARAWLLVCGAVLMNVVADMLFSYLTLQGAYYSGHISSCSFTGHTYCLH